MIVLSNSPAALVFLDLVYAEYLRQRAAGKVAQPELAVSADRT